MSTPTLEQSHACLALQNSPIPVLRQLAVEENDSAVVISGRVPSYYLKQLAQETIRRALGNRKLLNRITVDRELVPPS
jgi:hypothetical protein